MKIDIKFLVTRKEHRICLILIITWILNLFSVSANNNGLTVLLHARGVYESNLNLIPLSGPAQYKSIAKVTGVNTAQGALVQVSKDYLPGEFILNFESKEKKGSSSKPTEKRIIINNQNLEIWINPLYANIPDSVRFQPGELENTALASFTKENNDRLKGINGFQTFLMNYDDKESKFHKQGLKEYEKKRRDYNQWLNNKTIQDSSLFVRSTYSFYYIPEIQWQGSENEREQSVIQHYFDCIDFKDTRMIKTAQINDWMNAYVNMHMKLITKMSMRDSIISKAASSAIEKSKQGSPTVYGWMVDYFYKGFEANDIPAGMKALEPYLDDPNCLTSKRMEIERRLKGMESLVPGTKAPNILTPDEKGNVFNLDAYYPNTKYILLLFWSADCSHCLETVGKLYPWQQLTDNQQKVSVVAISVDETETEIQAWNQKIKELSGWKHIRATDGIRSTAASDYFVLATPVMILIDTKTKEIVSLPSSIIEMESKIK